MEIEAKISFTCETCGKSYTRKKYFAAHKRKKHGIPSQSMSSSKSFSCPVCAKVLEGYTKFSIRRHMECHEAVMPRRFKCEQCGLGFKYSVNLKKHQETHLENRERFKCELCPRDFGTMDVLERHVIAAHVVDKEFQCSICNQSFIKEKELKTHKREKHERTHDCDVCPKLFASNYGLRKHLQRIHSRTDICKLCQKSFPSKEECQQHIQEADGGPVMCTDPACELAFGTPCLADQHWSEVHKSTTQFTAVTDVDTVKEENVAFDCDLCKKSFASHRHLNSHARSVHPKDDWQCQVCLQTFKLWYNYNRHMTLNHTVYAGRTYYCSKCPKSYGNPSSYRYHLEKKHGEGEKLYKCPHCPKSFSSKSTLERNHVPSHFPGRPFPCEGCTKRFKTRTTLRQHEREWCASNELKRTINSDKYKCEICSQKFLSSSGLRYHVRNHNTDKPYKCSKCPKTYVYPVYLREHLKIAHAEGERQKPYLPYKCPHCPKRYLKRCILEEHHIPTHFDARPFSCDGCPVSFKTKAGLRAHLGRCPGERRSQGKISTSFTCPVCAKVVRGFTKYALEKHMKTHEAASYKCDQCGVSFKRSDHLKKHRQRIHSRTEVCKVCRKSFPSKEEYQQHTQGAGSEPVICPDPACKLAFGTLCFANQHWAEVHKSTKTSKTATDDSVGDQNNAKIDGDLCEKTLTSHRHLYG